METDNVKTTLVEGKEYGRRVIKRLYNGVTRYGNPSVMVDFLYVGEPEDREWLTCSEATFKASVKHHAS